MLEYILIGISSLAIICICIYILTRINDLSRDQDKLRLKIDELDDVVLKTVDVTRLISNNTTAMQKAISDQAMRSLMDLQEFRHLSPELKAKYHKYVVDKIMIAVATRLNNINVSDAYLQQASDEVVATLGTLG